MSTAALLIPGPQFSGSSVYITLAYTNASGPYVPASVQYELIDVYSASIIVDWTALDPSATTLTIAPADNTLLERPALERRELVVSATDESGNVETFGVCWNLCAILAACGCGC